MNRVFQDFGQQAVFEALISRGGTKGEARIAADKTPEWKSDKWRSIEKHIEDGAKFVRVGRDAEHTRLLRRREELERKIAALESEAAEVEDAISKMEDRNLAELLESEAA
jgi:hypothetical protein